MTLERDRSSAERLSRRDLVKLGVAGGTGVAVGTPLAPTAAAEEVPQLNTAKVLPERHQLIKGWGCFPYWMWIYPEIQTPPPDAMASALYRDLGINVMRVNIRHYCYDNDLATLDLDFIDRTLVTELLHAQTYGIDRWIASVWSPPISMKTYPTASGRWPAKDPNGEFTRLRPDAEDDYTHYLRDVLVHLISNGVTPPVGLSFQNELLGGHKWDACAYDPEQYQRVTKKLRRVLDNAGLQSVLVMGPEGGRMQHGWERLGGPTLPALQEDPALDESLGAIIHHSYDQSGHEDNWPQWQVYSEAAVATGKDLWMTEWCRAKPRATEAQRVVETIRHFARDLVVIENNYWVWWLGFQPTEQEQGQALIYGTYDDPVYSKEFYLFSALWNAAPPEVSVVRHLSTTDESLAVADGPRIDLVAFESADAMTVVVANPHPEAHPIQLTELPGSDYTVRRTSESENMDEVDRGVIVDGTVRLEVPGHTVSLVQLTIPADLPRLRSWTAHYAQHPGVARSLEAKLGAAERARTASARDGALGAFIAEVETHANRDRGPRELGLLRGQATLLARLAHRLRTDGSS